MKVIFYLLFIFLTNSYAGVLITVPENAKNVIPDIKKELSIFWSDHPKPNYFPALMEHESCLSLTHSKCMTPGARLKTKREEGAGLGQLTRTYTKSGKLRFDALNEMREKHFELRELSWSNVYQRQDLQIRATILKSKDDYRSLSGVKDKIERIYFTDAAYNQGIGRTMNERKICGLTTGCDPQKWFNHTEDICTANTVIYDNRTGCDISRNHVEDVTLVRMIKYKPLME